MTFYNRYISSATEKKRSKVSNFNFTDHLTVVEANEKNLKKLYSNRNKSRLRIRKCCVQKKKEAKGKRSQIDDSKAECFEPEAVEYA